MKVGIQGCVHGQLNEIYGHCAAYAEQNGPVDLLLLCGDFQAIRSRDDWKAMSVPERHRALGSFWEYYSGEKIAPILTIIVGGNHEASNYLLELFHGGWVAPNMYYLGAAGSVLVNGMRISGASGIYHDKDYKLGHYERSPLDKPMIHSVYHIKEYEIAKLSLLPRYTPSVFMSHDWPNDIAYHGNVDDLLKRMPRFRGDIENHDFGCVPFMPLLQTLQPDSWFSGHMHCCFSARVRHPADDIPVINAMPADTPSSRPKNAGSEPGGRMTRFLALDKCGQHEAFLKFLDFSTPEPVDGPLKLTYDPHWLAIVRALHPYYSAEVEQKTLPPVEELRALVDKEFRDITENGLLVPDLSQPAVDGVHPSIRVTGPVEVSRIQHFVPTAPHEKEDKTPEGWYANPQTAEFCAFVGIPNDVNLASSPDAPKRVYEYVHPATLKNQQEKKEKRERQAALEAAQQAERARKGKPPKSKMKKEKKEAKANQGGQDAQSQRSQDGQGISAAMQAARIDD